MLVTVVDLFNSVENDLASILGAAIGPRETSKEFVRDFVLNSEIMPFMAKVKLFMYLKEVNEWPKFEALNLHRLMQIKSRFLQCRSLTAVKMDINRGHQTFEEDITILLESLKSEGKFMQITVAEAFEEYVVRYDLVRQYFDEVRRITGMEE